MSFKYLIRSILIFVLVACSPLLNGQDGYEIVKKSDQKLRANSSFSVVRMEIIKPDWSREVRMKIWSLEPDYGLIYMTAPASDEGTVTLKRGMEVWNWLPRIQKAIKIPPSMMLQSWMGSDFTNDDLVRQSSIVEDYVHTVIGSEKVLDLECYKIEMIPKPEAGVVWGKIHLWITKADYLQLKVDYYDEDGVLIKSMYGKNIKKLDDREIPTYWEMVPHDKEGQKTVFEYLEADFNVDIAPSFFSKQNMKRVR